MTGLTIYDVALVHAAIAAIEQASKHKILIENAHPHEFGLTKLCGGELRLERFSHSKIASTSVGVLERNNMETVYVMPDDSCVMCVHVPQAENV